jgi:hypothetical protein
MRQSKGSNGLKILVVELARDLRDIEAIASSLVKAWEKASRQGLNDLEINGAAHLLEYFYTAIEELFLRIAKDIDLDVPTGEQWHREILQRMNLDLPEIRPAVISQDLTETLDGYRRFRHRARHVYAPPVPDWQKFSHLAAEAENTYRALKESIENWLLFLSAVSQKLP